MHSFVYLCCVRAFTTELVPTTAHHVQREALRHMDNFDSACVCRRRRCKAICVSHLSGCRPMCPCRREWASDQRRTCSLFPPRKARTLLYFLALSVLYWLDISGRTKKVYILDHLHNLRCRSTRKQYFWKNMLEM